MCILFPLPIHSIVPLEEGVSTALVKTISMTVYDIPSVEFPGQTMGSVSYGESFLESTVQIQRPDDRIEIDGKTLLLTGHIPRLLSWPVSETIMFCSTSDVRQKGVNTSHLHTKLDPFASQMIS